ncbi:MAG: translational GTPase TypA [Candidatus Wallbacteria bacterium]|nr:translational GTPase TypA [Candidatus Wallbacteria bacterium]
MDASRIRNIAIIAHVDHGKTTLVDKIFRACMVKLSKDLPTERVMDRNDLERERGITIFSKCASVKYGGCLINIVDTPGHCDFGGEVERILHMVDCALLLVDAVDGPMPQTRFVLRKVLERGMRPIVVINKMDRPQARSRWVEDRIFDLFVALKATDEQQDFPIVYASARDGWATLDHDKRPGDVNELLNLVISHVPPPEILQQKHFSMLVSNMSYNSYVGQLAHGRVLSGTVSQNEPIWLHRKDGSVTPYKVLRLFAYEGLEERETPRAGAGQIITLAGIDGLEIGDTITGTQDAPALPRISVDEPTISMYFYTNVSPFAGREGKYVTSRKLRERLLHEKMGNPAIRVEDGQTPDAFLISGRGELQLSILIETMRREGYELEISRPMVIFREEDGKRLEPFEELIIDVDNVYLGAVMENLGARRGEVLHLANDGAYTRVEIKIPVRGLFGFHNEFMSLTRGNGVLNQSFFGYGPFCGEFTKKRKGALVAMENGKVAAYALIQLADRGRFFVEPGDEAYIGMIVGEHSRDNDLPVNICKERHLSNVRSSTKEIAERIPQKVLLSLEQCLEFIGEDELVEVTPGSIRMRKKILDHTERSRAKKYK